VRVRGVDLAVRECGAGTCLLWGHGLLGSVAQEDAAALFDWNEIASAARVVRYDARGHGASEVTLDPNDYRWPDLALDLLGLADALGAGRAVFGGLSMGCATALHAAAAAPERTVGLVLVAPPTAWETRPRQARFYRALAFWIERTGLGPLRCAARLRRLAPGPPHLARLSRSVVEQLRRTDARAAVAALRGAAASDLPEPAALAAIEAPALVLAWTGDRAHPLATAERLAELLPDARLRVADTLDHVLGWSEQMRAFLEELRPRLPAAAPPPA
jgi:pimeloyl-ACP methyl ester carboxylesterase